MSSFLGRMREYPHVSLDRFDRENVHARAYFLSHCHKDHMKGLKGPLLRRKLQSSRTVRLYCSFVTKELLLSNNKYSFWEDYIVPLELESPSQICLVDESSGEKEDLVVTLLPAGHCPGSVMFLFEGGRGNVLYTGDFRLSFGDAARIEHLHSGSRVKDIQSVYLDSTFYDPRFYQIPSRDVCLSGISELVGNWISKSPYHVVWLNCKAAYGYEYLFTNLGEQFQTQIHVNNLTMFKKMPEILSYVTTDTRTQIHACRHPKDEEFFSGRRLPCGCSAADGTSLRIISIKPSTMWFGERSKKTNVIIQTGASSFRACFSFHSSFSEIQNFLQYLKPVNIYPNVVPIGQTLSQVTELLNKMCRKQSDPEAFIYKPLGVLKRNREEPSEHDTDSDDDLFDGDDLLPLRKKTPTQPESSKEIPSKSREQKEPTPESVSAKIPELQLQTHNYLDCTESNDEENDEEEEEEVGNGDSFKTEAIVKSEETEQQMSSAAPPKWEDFFKVEILPDSQTSQSLSSSTRISGSQTPDLFSETDEEKETAESSGSQQSVSASQSSPSNKSRESSPPRSRDCGPSHPSAQNQSSALPDTILLKPGQTHFSFIQSERDTEDLPDSQASSDFDIPCTPDSKIPKPEELLELYRKLASGEDVLPKKAS